MSQNLESSSAFAGPTGIWEIRGALSAISAPFAMSRRPKPAGRSSSLAARTTREDAVGRDPARTEPLDTTLAPTKAARRELPARAPTETGDTTQAETAVVSAAMGVRERVKDERARASDTAARCDRHG